MKNQIANSEEAEYPGCGLCKNHPNLDAYVTNVITESTVHGVKYIVSSNLKIIERIFWGIAVGICFGFSVYSIWNTIHKYYTGPVIISFQPKATKVSKIPFPAITICNINMFKTSVLTSRYKEIDDEIKRQRDLHKRNGIPFNYSDYFIRGATDMDTLAQRCLAAPSFRRKINEKLLDANGKLDFIAEVEQRLTQVNDTFRPMARKFERETHYNPESVFHQAAMNCKDMIINCLWSGKPIDCSKNFFRINVRSGRCCTFNMMPKFLLQNIPEDDHRAKAELDHYSEDVISQWRRFSAQDTMMGYTPSEGDEYPKFQKTGGKPYGLSILINPMLNEYSTCTTNDGQGFKLVAHTPISLPSVNDYGVAVPPSSEVFISIEPHVTIVDDKSLKDIEIDKRGCYMPSDRQSNLTHYNFYTEKNCYQECFAGKLKVNCGCVPHYLPRRQNETRCTARNHYCIENYREKYALNVGTTGYCSRCRPSCTEVQYKLQMSQFEIKQNIASSYVTYKNSDGKMVNASNYSILHLYFGTDRIYATERKKLFEISDMIANAGGLLSLCLGMSIISIVEFIYFFSIGACCEYRSTRNKAKNETHSNYCNGSKNVGTVAPLNYNYSDGTMRNRGAQCGVRPTW